MWLEGVFDSTSGQKGDFDTDRTKPPIVRYIRISYGCQARGEALNHPGEPDILSSNQKKRENSKNGCK